MCIEIADDLYAVHFLQEPEGYQRTPELLDEGEADHTAPLPDVNGSMNASLPGTSSGRYPSLLCYLLPLMHDRLPLGSRRGQPPQ